MIKSIMKRQVFFIQLSLRIFFFFFFFLFFFFAFDKVTSSLSMLLVALFFLVEKRSNSRLQIFFKIGGLKNFALFTENTCVGDSF